MTRLDAFVATHTCLHGSICAALAYLAASVPLGAPTIMLGLGAVIYGVVAALPVTAKIGRK